MTVTRHRPATEVLTELSRSLVPDGSNEPDVDIVGADPITPSPHRIGDAAAIAIGLFGQQLSAVAPTSSPRVRVRVDHAIDQLRAAYLTTVGGVHASLLTDDPAALGSNDFYRTRDGRWIFLITTYAHERDAVCATLNVPPIKERIASAAAERDAVELEDAVCAAGGVAAVVRSAEEWAEHPAGAHLAGRPVIELDRVGDAPPQPLPSGTPERVLAGLRVLDDTHVIAGPVSARLLAMAGADVLHPSRPDRPDPNAMVVITGGGKRNAFCDLRSTTDAARLHELAAAADVHIDSYRHLDRYGMGPAQLAKLNPGIVSVQFHCWGADGPWRDRGGFDQLACSATGFAAEEGGERPSLPPTYLLNDYLAAYLGAAGTLAALRRRSVEGGSWRVRITLASACTWVRELGMFARDEVESLPRPDAPALPLVEVPGPFGRIVEPALPLEFDGMPTPWPLPAWPLGSAELNWHQFGGDDLRGR